MQETQVSIPGLGRSTGEGNGHPLQYSGLENFMDCIFHGVAKSWTWLSNFHFHFTSSWETCVKVMKQQLELTWNNRLLPNWERTSRLCIVTLLIYLICRVPHAKCWAGWSSSEIKIFGRYINNLRYADDTTFMAESEEELRASWRRWKRTVKKLA